MDGGDRDRSLPRGEAHEGEKKMKARREGGREGGGGGEFDVIWSVVLNFLKGVRARMTVVDGEREEVRKTCATLPLPGEGGERWPVWWAGSATREAGRFERFGCIFF